MKKTDKQSVVVTGVAGEIGTACAKLYREKGFYVIGIDIDSPEEDIADTFIGIDLKEFVASDKARNKLSNSLHHLNVNHPVYTLVNNAALQIVKPFADLDYEDQLSTFQVNLFAPMELSRICYSMLKDSCGSIVNVASVHARATKKQFSIYASSKAALVSITKSLAMEYGPEIRVNCVSPAAIETSMLIEGFSGNKTGISDLKNCHISQRIGKPSEVAELIYFLSSDLAGFITGSDYSIDGGVLAKLFDPES